LREERFSHSPRRLKLVVSLQDTFLSFKTFVMAHTLSPDEIAELGCTYASLILHDDNVAITGDKIKALLDAAGVKVAPFWPNLFARVLASRNLDDLILSSGGSGGPAAPAASAAAATPAPTEQKEEKGGKGKGEEKKKKEEVKEQSDEDMGFGLFD